MTSNDQLQTEYRAKDFARTVLTMGVGCLVVSYFLAPNQLQAKGLFLLVLVSLYGEWRAVKLPGYGFLNPGEGFYLAAACLYGPVPAAILAASLGTLGDIRKKKRAVVRLFNIGWSLCTFSAVGMAFTKFGLVGAAVVYCLVAGWLQAHGEKYFSDLPLAQTLRKQCREMLLVAPSVFIFAYLTFLFFSIRPEAILLMALPVELLVTYVRTRELTKQLQTAMTELELAQSELVASGRKAALGVMAAGIAHEINSPLAAAVTNIHMLKMTANNKASKGSLQLLEKSVSRCQNIVARMLKYSRQSPSGGVLCRLDELVPDAVLFCGRSFEPEKVALEVQTSDLSVLADPTELVQVLSNLIANAYDSGAHLVRLEAAAVGERVDIRVIDDGAGMPDEVASVAFEPFFTTKAVGSGTGLGLSIAQGLAARFGGELRLERTSSEGSTFLLTLRMA